MIRYIPKTKISTLLHAAILVVATVFAIMTVYMILPQPAFAAKSPGAYTVSDNCTCDPDRFPGYYLDTEGVCGENVTYAIYRSTGDMRDNVPFDIMIVSGTGPMYDFAEDDPNRPQPDKLIIEEGVTAIGDCAFYWTEVSEAELPRSLVKISKKAFAASALKSIGIPDGVTSIGGSAFRECENLTEISFGDNVQKIGSHAFEGSGLKSVSLPDSLASMGSHVFCRCYHLKSVDLGSGLTALSARAFLDCEKLTSLTIPQNITKLGPFALAGCGFQEITIPAAVKEVGPFVFCACEKLRTITVEGKKTVKFGHDVFFKAHEAKIVIKCPNMKRTQKKKFRAMMKKIAPKARVK